jgi:hypothetical protein
MLSVPALLAAALALPAADALPSEPFGQFAFVPQRRQFRLTPLYEYAHAREFFDGAGERLNFPQSQSWWTQTGGVRIEYGLAPYVAADITVSAVAMRGPAASGEGSVSSLGLGDTQFGLRWRLLDEDLKEYEPFVPTLTLRLGGIAPGTYDPDVPFAPGTGASGLETRVMMSDTLGATPFSLYGEVGWRWFAGGASSQVFGAAGGGIALPLRGAWGSLSANCGYAFNRSRGGASVSGPGEAAWATTDWRELGALDRGVQLGLGLTDHGGRRYQVWASLPLEGRNTPNGATFGAFVRIPFPKLPRRSTLW